MSHLGIRREFKELFDIDSFSSLLNRIFQFLNSHQKKFQLMLKLLALFKALCFSLEAFKAMSPDRELTRGDLLHGLLSCVSRSVESRTC